MRPRVPEYLCFRPANRASGPGHRFHSTRLLVKREAERGVDRPTYGLEDG